MKTVQHQQCDSVHDIENAGSMSSAQLRKINKPIVEKKRRERINACLDELKDLLIHTAATTKQETSHSKLEKADILEMTVRHLRNIQRSNRYIPYPTTTGISTNLPDSAGLVASRSPTSSYCDGYSDCAREVATYLGRLDSVGLVARTRVLSHLSSRMRIVNGKLSKEKFPVAHSSTGVVPLPSTHVTAAAVSPLSSLPHSYLSDRVEKMPGGRGDTAAVTSRLRVVATVAAETTTKHDFAAAMTSDVTSYHRQQDWTMRFERSVYRPTSDCSGHLADVTQKSNIDDSHMNTDDDVDDCDDERHLPTTTRTVDCNAVPSVKNEVPTSSSCSYDLNGNNIDVSGYDDYSSDVDDQSAPHDDVWRPW